MLNSLGGVQLIFPIVEQVDLSVKQRGQDDGMAGVQGEEPLVEDLKLPSVHGTLLKAAQPACCFDGE